MPQNANNQLLIKRTNHKAGDTAVILIGGAY